MADARFFRRSKPLLLEDLATIANAELAGNVDPSRHFSDVMPLHDAGPMNVSFLDNTKYLDAFSVSAAGACVVRRENAAKAPDGMALLITDEPYLGYARIAASFYPMNQNTGGVSPQAAVDPRASITGSVRVEPMAVVQAGAEIADGCYIGAGSVVGRGVVIGENSSIGANVTLSHCRIGQRVIIHPGVCIGQDGFGFALNPAGHEKVPQLGRVIIEDDVEIGANSTVDRGAGPDTVIGSGTKIDNLVQIAHNVQIGKGCIIVSQAGISGSTVIGDFVLIGGQAGLTGHLKIGSGAQIAGKSGVMRNVEPGAKMGGYPAKPMRNWLKEVAFIERLMKNKGN